MSGSVGLLWNCGGRALLSLAKFSAISCKAERIDMRLPRKF